MRLGAASYPMIKQGIVAGVSTTAAASTVTLTGVSTTAATVAGPGASAIVGLLTTTSYSLAAAINATLAIATATLAIAGTTLETEGTLSGHETRSSIGTILNLAALGLGLGASLPQLIPGLPKLASRVGSYLRPAVGTASRAGIANSARSSFVSTYGATQQTAIKNYGARMERIFSTLRD